MTGAFFSEWEPFAAAWVRELQKAGVISEGEVMSGPLRISYQPSLFDSEEFTSLPGSRPGTTHSTSPGGATDPCGVVPAPASLSPRQARERGLLTSGTYGPRSSTSSAGAALSCSLANRLRARTDTLGSTLFALTWKVLATPSGRPLPLLRATARRTPATVSTGWPSPRVADATRGGNPGRYTNGTDRGGEELTTAASLVAWNTPRATDGEKGGPGQTGGALPPDAALVPSLAWVWPTPATADGDRGSATYPGGNLTLPGAALMASPWATPSAAGFGVVDADRLVERRAECKERTGNGNGFGLTLDQMAVLVTPTGFATWQTPSVSDSTGGHAVRGGDRSAEMLLPGQARAVVAPVPSASSKTTPTVQDAANCGAPSQFDRNTLPLNAQVRLTGSGETPSGSPAPTGSTGQLNPALSRWLMGLPAIWDLCALRVTPTVRTRNVSSTPRSSRKAKPAPADSVGTATPSSSGKRSRSSKRSKKPSASE